MAILAMSCAARIGGTPADSAIQATPDISHNGAI
jgi:hypothetical protein